MNCYELLVFGKIILRCYRLTLVSSPACLVRVHGHQQQRRSPLNTIFCITRRLRKGSRLRGAQQIYRSARSAGNEVRDAPTVRVIREREACSQAISHANLVAKPFSILTVQGLATKFIENCN